MSYRARRTAIYGFICHVLVAILASTTASHLLQASDPYIPASDDEVLLALPAELLAIRSEVAKLREQLSSDKQNASLAADVAGRYIKIGNREGNPRYFGYAQAAIAPWWDDPFAPPAILSIRAKLKEKDHRYNEALKDIDKIVEQQPGNAQAWVERINLLRVQGKYAEAWEACDRLESVAGADQAQLFRIPIMAVTGQADQAAQELERLVAVAQRESPAVAQWANILQADIARMLGDTAAAEACFKRGLSSQPGNTYLLRRYADLLLDQSRPEEALQLLRDHVRDNGVLLRAAIAAQHLGNDELARDFQQQLERRFDEIRLRGNEPHGRFEARYLLELQRKPKEALAVALANWNKQKEYRDTRNVLEAAVAARDPDGAKPVLEFLAKHGTQDADFVRLIAKLEAL